jgi:hypothetical protein
VRRRGRGTRRGLCGRSEEPSGPVKEERVVRGSQYGEEEKRRRGGMERTLSLIPSMRARTSRVYGMRAVSTKEKNKSCSTEEEEETHSFPLLLLNLLILNRPNQRINLQRHRPRFLPLVRRRICYRTQSEVGKKVEGVSAGRARWKRKGEKRRKTNPYDTTTPASTTATYSTSSTACSDIYLTSSHPSRRPSPPIPSVLS